jgi:NADPH:quinone reductase-like Zn-dependent oxidoreductase
MLVEVHASTVTTADWRLRASAFPGATWLPGRMMTGLFRPRRPILGTEFAGRVVELGSEAEGFRIGDRVFGFSGFGGNAEYVAIPASGPVAPIPDPLGYEEAAALPFGAVSALVFLRDVARVKAGARVLVIGASGGVGAYAVQIARALGAVVTGVASDANRKLMLELGATDVLDYRQTRYDTTGRQWDVIVDTAGFTDFATARRALTSDGVFVPLNFGLRAALGSLWSSLRRGPKMRIAVSGDSRAHLDEIAKMIRAGTLRPVIDRVYPLDEVARAHRHVEGRHRKGAVVLSVRTGGAQAPSLAYSAAS